MGNSSSAQREFRTVHIGQPDCYQFPNNEVISSKYTLWSFLPKNLYEQFRRFANICFVIITILSLFNEGPVSPIVYVVPIVLIMGTTAIKQGYEDFCRHRADAEANLITVSVLREGCVLNVPSKHVCVGDIVRIQSEEDIPCDMILLVSSQEDRNCFVTTANLDGETNLKVMECPTGLDIQFCDLSHISGVIMCEEPTPNLYSFSGSINIDEIRSDQVSECPHGHVNKAYESTADIVQFNNKSGECSVKKQKSSFKKKEYTEYSRKAPVTAKNILLRGSRLKTTNYVYGCAVYTGQQTKLALNSRLSKNKFSTVERTINWFLLFFFCLLIMEACLSTAFELYEINKMDNFFFLGPPRELRIARNLFNYIVLYYYIIPTSMYVTIELQRFWGTVFFESDLELFNKDRRAICNTSDLNEELGQVQYIFTDKTGTLTENEMEFQRCFVNGKTYYEEEGMLFLLPKSGNRYRAQPVPPNIWTEELDNFFLALALCHTVQCDQQSDPVQYQSSSTDEKAFVEASARCGIEYLGTVNDIMKINFKGELKTFKKLEVLEFSSERKRMSIVVSDENTGTIWLYCKGAESSLIPLLGESFTDEANNHIQDFSSRGLRTLVFGIRQISISDLNEGKRKLLEARSTLDQETRELLIDAAFSCLENDLKLIGITAVEDRLQEYVPETLATLYASGIKVWVLTGDKVETAKSIAYSCGHFKPGTEVINLTEFSGVDSCLQSIEYFRQKVRYEKFKQFGLVLDGSTLTIILKNDPEPLIEIALSCTAILCCRLSPKQKAQIVSLVKHCEEKPITLAIGDGANDISMIQEAHIGIGIMGKEGQQAVFCSDFAFAEFHSLRKALLVHGRWYYLRASNLILYFFYKNIVFITPQVYFAFGMSPQVLYCSLYLLLYNTLFTAAPIVIYGLLEQDYRAKILLSYPELYKRFTNNKLMSWNNFITWILFGVWHSLVIYFIPYFTVFDDSDVGLITFGTAILHLAIFVVNLKMLLFSQYWTLVFVLSIIGSIITFMAFTLYYSLCFSIITTRQVDIENMYGIHKTLYCSLWFWKMILLCIVLSLLPDVIYHSLERSGMKFEELKPSILTTRKSFDVGRNDARRISHLAS